MFSRDKPPKERPGYKWEYREGCPDGCKCPWAPNCTGKTWHHWIEVKK